MLQQCWKQHSARRPLMADVCIEPDHQCLVPRSIGWFSSWRPLFLPGSACSCCSPLNIQRSYSARRRTSTTAANYNPLTPHGRSAKSTNC